MEIIKLGTFVDEKGKVINLSIDQIGRSIIEFVVFVDGKYNRDVVSVEFIESEPSSGIYNSFGATLEVIGKINSAYDNLKAAESMFFVTSSVNGFGDSATLVSKESFDAKNLKIVLKVLTQKDKVDYIKDNWDSITARYLERYLEVV